MVYKAKRRRCEKVVPSKLALQRCGDGLSHGHGIGARPTCREWMVGYRRSASLPPVKTVGDSPNEKQPNGNKRRTYGSADEKVGEIHRPTVPLRQLRPNFGRREQSRWLRRIGITSITSEPTFAREPLDRRESNLSGIWIIIFSLNCDSMETIKHCKRW